MENGSFFQNVLNYCKNKSTLKDLLEPSLHEKPQRSSILTGFKTLGEIESIKEP